MSRYPRQIALSVDSQTRSLALAEGYADKTLAFGGLDAAGEWCDETVVYTAEVQRSVAKYADWERECWYAGILGADLPPKPFPPMGRLITGISVVRPPRRLRERS